MRLGGFLKDDVTKQWSSSRLALLTVTFTVCACLCLALRWNSKGWGKDWDKIINSLTIALVGVGSAYGVKQVSTFFGGKKNEQSTES